MTALPKKKLPPYASWCSSIAPFWMFGQINAQSMNVLASSSSRFNGSQRVR